jgi:hypothetical protein
MINFARSNAHGLEIMSYESKHNPFPLLKAILWRRGWWYRDYMDSSDEGLDTYAEMAP